MTMSTGSLARALRHALVVVGLVGLALAASPALAQEPPAPAPETAKPEPAKSEAPAPEAAKPSPEAGVAAAK